MKKRRRKDWVAIIVIAVIALFLLLRLAYNLTWFYKVMFKW